MLSTNIHAPQGLLRLSDVIAPDGPLPVSRSTWFVWVKEGRVPQPIKLGPRVTAYRAADIHAFMADPESWAANMSQAGSHGISRDENLGGRQ